MPNIHPMFVHFPIALIFVVLAFDLFGILFRRQNSVATGTVLAVLAALGATAAVITGLIAEDSVPHGGAVHDLLEIHETLGFVFLGIVVVMAVVRLGLGKKLGGRLNWAILLFDLAAAAVITAGAYLGGEMVFKHGLGVSAIEQGITPGERDNLDSQEHRHDD